MTIQVVRGFDASKPPATPPDWARYVWGYIGGNTPHVWTPAQWDRFGHLAQFPIWVGVGESDPALQARTACTIAYSRGWYPFQPSRRAIILDRESQVEAWWVNTFADEVWRLGFITYTYFSLSAGLADPPRAGRLIAEWNGKAGLVGEPDEVGHQYQADVVYGGTQIDLSVMTVAAMAHAGHGPRSQYQGPMSRLPSQVPPTYA